MLEEGETILFEGRAGYETPINRGWLTLTNRRLLWERTLSMDPFAENEVALSLTHVKSCEERGDAIALNTTDGEILLFPQWWVLSILTGNKRTKEWHHAINRAIAKTPTAAP